MTFRPEFQAVVLAAGKGSRIPEITAGKPKCLLPVGAKPLVWYPLHKLQSSGFTDVILIVLENQKSEIQSCLEKTDLNIKIEYFAISSNEDLGTADSLRLIHDKLYSDVLVLTCDIVTDINLKETLNLFRKHNSSLTSLFFYPQNLGNVQSLIPGPKSKHKPERDIIGIDAQTNRLVFLASASDFENEISLPTSLLKKHTNIKFYSNLLDSHIYVLRNWVIKYLKSEENISTLKGEFLPHVIKKQLSRPEKKIDTNQSIVGNETPNDIASFAKESDLDIQIREYSSYNDHYGDLKPAYHGDSIRCYAYIAPQSNIGIRVNTLPSYCLVNNMIIEMWAKINTEEKLILQHPKAEIKSNQVDDKCIIWENAKLNEKTSFKNSIIGNNVEVNSFSRVFNSIVMNNVVIQERVALENCIVSEGAVIGKNSQLKSCLIGSRRCFLEC